jgi:hypothetical protein
MPTGKTVTHALRQSFPRLEYQLSEHERHWKRHGTCSCGALERWKYAGTHSSRFKIFGIRSEWRWKGITGHDRMRSPTTISNESGSHHGKILLLSPGGYCHVQKPAIRLVFLIPRRETIYLRCSRGSPTIFTDAFIYLVLATVSPGSICVPRLESRPCSL